MPLELDQKETAAVCDAVDLTLERTAGQLVMAYRDRHESKVRKEAAFAARRWADRVLDGEQVEVAELAAGTCVTALVKGNGI